MKRSTNVIVSNLSGDKILISTFYTGLFFTFWEKTGGARAPPAPPLATALPSIVKFSQFERNLLSNVFFARKLDCPPFLNLLDTNTNFY